MAVHEPISGSYSFLIAICFLFAFDIPTAAIAPISLVFLWRFKLPEPVIVLLSGAIGLTIQLLLNSQSPLW